ncbi:Indigoidine synthase A like protein-domain-containing protein [Tricharina praecox]|uniref:Indigoidine synthase A like protein-domain-containing protein n=1 Tax=Tricharina praecox TaxID=43433 RepID=UPI002220C3F4|nr:Indigoidine synthase A like protein-domain-containing protein [Tricharina praecox]KAI5840930.1 Indigoidine synthase A like protein-domain-containing protein [Tricharina praecox]
MRSLLFRRGLRAPPRYYSTLRASSRLSQYLSITPEVQSALSAGHPVVALESAIYTHGFPHPANLSLAREIEAVIRANGAVPATICILNGKARIGLEAKELEQLADAAGKSGTAKVSRRDLGYLLAGAGATKIGGTTIAGTSVLAHLAGIKVFATGGLGGVHRGVQNTMDVSADLTELGRTPVAVVCAGSKAFLDLPRTLEYLETEGVYVGTFRDGRDAGEVVEFPAFWSRGCGIKAPSVVEDANEAARIIYASHSLGLTSGHLFTNPIPAAYEIPNEEIQSIIAESVKVAEGKSSGKDVTPFILNDILKRTGGRSIEANRGLILNNAAMGAKVAVELARLEGTGERRQTHMPHIPPSQIRPKEEANPVVPSPPPEVVVVGGVAVDVNCDTSSPTPSLHTSNPSTITESLGGVGNNVAYALHLSGVRTRLVSSVGADLAGSWVRERVQERGMDTEGIFTDPARATARYVAVNDANGGLFVASADMRVIEHLGTADVTEVIKAANAEWVVLDGNLSQQTTKGVLEYCLKSGIKAIFEPTSTAKSAHIFHATLPSHPSCALGGAILYATSLPWWPTIDALTIDSGFRDRVDQLAARTGVDLSESGIVQKAVSLLPYIPRLFVKLGEQGVIVVRLLEVGEKPRRSRESVVVEAREGEEVGGVEVRYFAAEKLGVDGVQSVNGAGDTFLGVLVAAMVRGLPLEEAVGEAQKAAVLTLGVKEAVSARIRPL